MIHFQYEAFTPVLNTSLLSLLVHDMRVFVPVWLMQKDLSLWNNFLTV